MLFRVKSGIAAATISMMAAHAAFADETITLRSGNGTLGATDNNITFMTKGDFSIAPFSPSDFQAAATGQHAAVTGPFILWISSLPDDPAAQWIAVNQYQGAESALYAYSFQVQSPSIASATIDLKFAVDNYLGEATVPGLYINGQPVPGSGGMGGFDSELHFSSDQIGPLLQPGTNTLYFYQYDTDGLAGSLFSATITIQGGTVLKGPVAIQVQPAHPKMPVALDQPTVGVTIFGTPTFDVTKVDPSSAQFGPGNAPSVSTTGTVSDINGDGYPDLTLRFNTAATGIAAGPSIVTFSVKATNGVTFSSAEAITAK